MKEISNLIFALSFLLSAGTTSAWAANGPVGQNENQVNTENQIGTSIPPGSVSPRKVSLDVLAAQSMDRGAVMLYSKDYGADHDVRLCFGLMPGTPTEHRRGSVALYDCDFRKVEQKWLLDSSHQIRAQYDPSQCLFWPSGEEVTLVRLQDASRRLMQTSFSCLRAAISFPIQANKVAWHIQATV